VGRVVTVYLVGAGPGDPGLLTVRGRELLGRCDALVYDRLADPRIVALAPASAERVYAGKRPGGHTLTQDQINEVLVDLGRRRECVVRLKGGDPFVFGRGGEEGLALAAAGIGWEVVPGISSAYAVPAYAGIPVTHRGLAAQVTFVTGHEDPAKPGSDLDWASLAAAPGTLVFLMGVRALAANAARLIEHGMSPDTPAAVISHGTRPSQRTVTAPLSRIADEAADLVAPAITLVGAVAGLRDRLTWYEQRPLFGLRVAVTRARAQASGLAARLSELGADVVEAPSITIEPIEFEAPDLSSYDIVCVTSANGVERLLDGDVRVLHGVTVAAVGRATAAALAGRGIVADVVPAQAVSDALPEALGEVRGARVLVATAEGARPVLPDGLRERGAEVEVLHTYRTVHEQVDTEAVAECDLVTFTSSSTVDNVLGPMAEAHRESLLAVSIGPVTSEALRRYRVEPLVEADPHDVEGLVEAVLQAAAIESRPG
jgi:uroporphyrinogen III methyltransferase / synthase